MQFHIMSILQTGEEYNTAAVRRYNASTSGWVWVLQYVKEERLNGWYMNTPTDEQWNVGS